MQTPKPMPTPEQAQQAISQALLDLLDRQDAMEDTLAALTMLAVRHMPASQRPTFVEGIAKLSAVAERERDMKSATLLTKLQAAAVRGAGSAQ